jgi:hypothetical protein
MKTSESSFDDEFENERDPELEKEVAMLKAIVNNHKTVVVKEETGPRISLLESAQYKQALQKYQSMQPKVKFKYWFAFRLFLIDLNIFFYLNFRKSKKLKSLKQLIVE